MLKKNSVYKCPVCGATLEAAPAINISCSNCNVKMDEVKKGVVTKKVVGKKGGKKKA